MSALMPSAAGIDLRPGDRVQVPTTGQWGTVDSVEDWQEWPGAVLVYVDGQPYASFGTADRWPVADAPPLF